MFDTTTGGGVVFHAAAGLDAPAIAAVPACVRRRLLRVFVRRGLLPGDDARAMAQWQHGGGFSVDGSANVIAYVQHLLQVTQSMHEPSESRSGRLRSNLP